MKISKILILSAAALSLAACGEHTHSFGEAWKSDDTSHWHECECGEKSDKADHLDTNADGKCDACNHEMEVQTPTGTEVTKEEWTASIGMKKPFLFADNYKFNMLGKMNGVDFAEENFYADGNKFKDEPVKAPEGETLGTESYYSFENSKYVAYQFTGGKWSTHETSSTPIHSIIQTSLAPFGNPDLFTYDETSMSYKCETTTMGVTFINLEIKFVEKKITKITFTVQGADYICSLTYGGQTVTLPDIPQPSANEVTSSEWVAAFGLDKPYYMADNYNAVMRMNMEDETVYPSSYLALQVDGLKAKMTNKEVCTHEEEQFYEKVNNVYNAYLYGQKRENKWDLFENVSNPARNFANFLEPIVGSYSSFTYNQSDLAYKCASLDYEGTILTNVSVKFADKKVVNASFDSTWGIGLGSSTPFHWTYEIVYGGQTVTLPEIDSEPSGEEYKVTETQFNTAFSLEGLNNVTITTSAGSLSQTCEADGTKEFNVNMKPYNFYLNKENGVMYEYKQEDDKWVKNQKEGTTFAREDMIRMFGNVYNQLTFDEDSNSYKGTNISIEGAVRYLEVEYCFENLKVVAIHAVVVTGSSGGQSMTVTLTKYGQTVVNLPKIDSERAQGMTEDEFNALVNVINNVGLTILAKNTPMVEGVQIPEAASHTTYKYNVENEAYYLCTVGSDGSTSESKVVNQVSYYSYNGAPYQVRDLTPEQAHNSFIEIKAEAMAALLPSTDFSDYEYDSINDNYRLEISFEYDGIAVEEVLFYEMNADGITSVKGTSTATFEDQTMDSFLEIKNIVLGPQEIIA